MLLTGVLAHSPIQLPRHKILVPTRLPKPMAEAEVVAFFRVIDALQDRMIMLRLRKDGQQVDHAVTRVRPPMIRIIAGYPQWRHQRLQLHKDLISAFHSCSLNSIYTRPGGHTTQFIQPGPWSYTDRVVYLPVVSQTTRKGPASTGRCRRLSIPQLSPQKPGDQAAWGSSSSCRSGYHRWNRAPSS